MAFLTRVFLAAALASSLPACVSGSDQSSATATGTPYAAADGLFHQEPRWLGADAAYSIALGPDRVAWLFGDTFVATSDALLRSQSRMVRNTVAVETGLDPTTASMQFSWHTAVDSGPASFFAEDGDHWHWPGGGVRLAGGPLVVFLSILRPDSGGLGFASAGWRVALIDNPDAVPSAWHVTLANPPAGGPAGLVVGTAVTVDGDSVIALATNDSHQGYLARFAMTALAVGDLGAITWWDGTAFSSGPPVAIIDDTGSEASLHFDAALGLWVHIASRGFGATTIALRTAPKVTGPWSAAQDVFTPPESTGPSPFVYAGKGHSELLTPDGSLAITYATNSFNFGDLFTPDGAAHLYWPRFARLAIRLGAPLRPR